MREIPRFLELDEVLEIHAGEIRVAGGSAEIRDRGSLESAVGAPKATHSGKFLMGLFEMAATYANSIALSHPFIDGNKRTAAAAALTFLYLNGFEIEESYDEELADKIIALVKKEITKDQLARYFQDRSKGL